MMQRIIAYLHEAKFHCSFPISAWDLTLDFSPYPSQSSYVVNVAAMLGSCMQLPHTRDAGLKMHPQLSLFSFFNVAAMSLLRPSVWDTDQLDVAQRAVLKAVTLMWCSPTD